jgi:hypothetical protein
MAPSLSLVACDHSGRRFGRFEHDIVRNALVPHDELDG